MSKQKIERHLTLKDVAETLQVALATARKYVKTGQLKAWKLPNGAIRVAPADLEAFVKGRRLIA